MAKINVCGDAVVIKSDLKLEDIKLLEKYRPDCLTVKDDEGEPVFKLGTTCCGGTVNKYGVSFASATHDDEGLAVFTTMFACCADATLDEIKDCIADEFGQPVAMLTKLEESLKDVIDEVKAERDAILAGIEVA